MILCVLTGQQYISPSHAADAVGVSLPTALKSLKTGVAIRHRTLSAYTWLIDKDTPPIQPPSDNRQQRIRCVTTGEEYDTMSNAADAHGFDITALSRAIRHNKAIHGKKFEKI